MTEGTRHTFLRSGVLDINLIRHIIIQAEKHLGEILGAFLVSEFTASGAGRRQKYNAEFETNQGSNMIFATVNKGISQRKEVLK